MHCSRKEFIDCIISLSYLKYIFGITNYLSEFLSTLECEHLIRLEEDIIFREQTSGREDRRWKG